MSIFDDDQGPIMPKIGNTVDALIGSLDGVLYDHSAVEWHFQAIKDAWPYADAEQRRKLMILRDALRTCQYNHIQTEATRDRRREIDVILPSGHRVRTSLWEYFTRYVRGRR